MWFDAFRNIFGHHSKGGLMYLETSLVTFQKGWLRPGISVDGLVSHYLTMLLLSTASVPCGSSVKCLLLLAHVCVGTGRCLLLPRTGRQLGLTHTCETHITSWIFSGSIGLPWLAVIVGSTICHLQLMFYWKIAEITIFFCWKWF